MAASVSRERVDGLDAIRIEDERLSLLLLPEVGSKIVSFVHKPSGREWIWRNPKRTIAPPRYGSDYAEWDISGYDDCFPTIGACPYPEEPWRGAEAPDHGEVWTLPWRAAIEGDEVLLEVSGVRFPYRLRKRLSLDADGLALAYELENPTPFPFKYLFSAHPLFAVTPTTEVELPEGVRVRVDSSMGGVLGARYDEHPWPVARGIDLRKLDPSARRGDKLYTTPLHEGRARLVDRASGEWVGFTWDAARLPLCGVWLNQGAWPSPEDPCFNVALEPCSGYPDPLDQAIARGEHGTVAPHGTVRWELVLNAGPE